MLLNQRNIYVNNVLWKITALEIVIVMKMYTCICHVNILCIIIIGTVCLKLTGGNMSEASCASATICIMNKILYAFIISSVINTSSTNQIVFTLTAVIISDEENKLWNLFHNPLSLTSKYSPHHPLFSQSVFFPSGGIPNFNNA